VVTICTASLSLTILRSAYTAYLCESENKQRLFPYTTLTDFITEAESVYRTVRAGSSHLQLDSCLRVASGSMPGWSVCDYCWAECHWDYIKSTRHVGMIPDAPLTAPGSLNRSVRAAVAVGTPDTVCAQCGSVSDVSDLYTACGCGWLATRSGCCVCA
jgi:hypothetical protein